MSEYNRKNNNYFDDMSIHHQPTALITSH